LDTTLGNLHYTWGKAIGVNRGDLGFGGGTNIQNFFDIRSNRGRAEGDVTYRFVSDFVYDLPALENSYRPVRFALGGWQIAGVLAAQTGQPLNVTQPNTLGGQRPDLVDPANAIVQSRGDSLQYLNRAAFARVPVSPVSAATLRPGTLGNGAVEGPGLWNLDISLGRNFRVTDKSRIQLRGELFNAFNHTNFSGIDTNIDSARFGVITSTAGARQIQLNLRVQF